MTARRARALYRRIERNYTGFFQQATYGGFGEVDDLQRIRNLVFQCLIEIFHSKLRYDDLEWSRHRNAVGMMNTVFFFELRYRFRSRLAVGLSKQILKEALDFIQIIL